MSNLNSLNTSPGNLNDMRNEKCFKQQEPTTAVAGKVTDTLLRRKSTRCIAINRQ